MSKDTGILKITVKLDKSTQSVDLDADLAVERTKINDELAEQPGLFAWYATIHELYRNKVLALKEQIDVLEAQLDQELRAKWNEPEWGKRTEDAIKARIKLNTKRQDLAAQFLEAQKNQGILGVAKSAFEQRKDMLISIAANMRGESDLELKVSKEKVKAQLEKLRKEG